MFYYFRVPIPFGDFRTFGLVGSVFRPRYVEFLNQPHIRSAAVGADDLVLQ